MPVVLGSNTDLTKIAQKSTIDCYLITEASFTT